MISKFPAAHRKPTLNRSSTAHIEAMATMPEPAHWPAKAIGVDAGDWERVGRFTAGRLHERGQSVLEFALGLPLLLTLITGLVMFGIAFNNELTLTYAADAAAQLLSISRGQTTDPCQTTANAVYSSAPYLNQSDLAFTIVLGGHSYAGASCSGAQLVESETAQVTVTYPCSLGIFGFSVANFSLTAQTTALVQ